MFLLKVATSFLILKTKTPIYTGFCNQVVEDDLLLFLWKTVNKITERHRDKRGMAHLMCNCKQLLAI